MSSISYCDHCGEPKKGLNRMWLTNGNIPERYDAPHFLVKPVDVCTYCWDSVIAKVKAIFPHVRA